MLSYSTESNYKSKVKEKQADFRIWLVLVLLANAEQVDIVPLTLALLNLPKGKV
jgi:hypothetical protein